MKDDHILAIDCGTQSIRALIFDRHGNLLGKEKAEFEPYFSVAPGYAEQNAELYWKSACEACQKLKARESEKFGKVMGVVVTTQRDTVVFVDKGGLPLRPAILWLDQRMADCDETMSMIDNVKYSVVGMKKAIMLMKKKSKAWWVREQEPETWEKTHKLLLLSGYFHFKLTGKFVDSIANQVGHVPYDYKLQNWPESDNSFRWDLFGVDRDRLPELMKPATMIGEITAEAARETGIASGTPIISGGSDKGCETIGMGCVDEKSASLSFGTTATIETTTTRYIEPERFLPSYTAVIPGCFNPEIEIIRGYWMISWFKKEFGMREMIEAKDRGISPEEVLNETLNRIPPGSQGLVLQPFWGGGHKTPEAKGAVIGFGDVHTRAHLYRAIIEGVNYGLIDGMEKIERKTGVRVSDVMVSGGGSQSDAICQITADMFNRRVVKGATYEASGLGAAMCGFVAMNEFSSFKEAAKEMVHYSREFVPDAGNAQVYKELYHRVYKKVYPNLKGLYREIQHITGYPDF